MINGNGTYTGAPVAALPRITFEWHTKFVPVFDKHVDLVQQDILRALAANQLPVYLSCPISSRGGSFSATNLEVADATARRLTTRWGDRFWILNPAQYQLESAHGLGLVRRHVRELKAEGAGDFDVDELIKTTAGGDYMRMWTRVLVEDEAPPDAYRGRRFFAYYFIGPSDYWHFFSDGGRTSLADGVEAYLARKIETLPDFKNYFSPPFLGDDGNELPDQNEEWLRRRKEFLAYYTVRAGAAFSRGSHDEWNIWVALNKLRLGDPKMGVGTQIPGFYDGHQVDPVAAETPITRGYAPEKPEHNKVTKVPPVEPATEATSPARAAKAL